VLELWGLGAEGRVDVGTAVPDWFGAKGVCVGTVLVATIVDATTSLCCGVGNFGLGAVSAVVSF
jgi:hypothetical protein